MAKKFIDNIKRKLEIAWLKYYLRRMVKIERDARWQIWGQYND